MARKTNGASPPEPKPDDLEIEIVDGPAVEEDPIVGLEPEPPQPTLEVDTPITPEPPPREIAPEEGIEALKANLAEAQRQRDEANARAADEARRRQVAESRAGQSAKDVRDTQIDLLNSAIEGVNAAQEGLKAKLKEARMAGDVDAEFEIQSKVAENAANLAQLRAGKDALEKQAKEPPPPSAPQGDPVEVLASQLTPKSAAWVRSHPEYARDQTKYLAMLGAHNAAVGMGLEPDSDRYFAKVESILEIAKPTEPAESPLSEAAAPTERRQAPPAAPPSRASTNGSTSPSRVTLTRDEVEMAESMGMTPQEYAREKLALLREGKMKVN